MRLPVMALAVFAIIALPWVCAAQSTLNFARVIAPGNFTTTGFAVVNPASTPASVTFNLYGESGGSPIEVFVQAVPARGQVAKLASELFTGVSAGWVQATSATAGLQAFWFGGDFSTFADGAETATSSNELVLPFVAPQSEINIANTGTIDVTVVLRVAGEDGGDLWDAYPKRIPAKGFLKADVGTLFAGIDDFAASRHLRIECGCPDASYAASVVAREFISAPSLVVANAVPASQNSVTINFPHVVDGLAPGGANWKSVLGLTNLSKTASNDITIAFIAENGAVLRTVLRTLPPNGALRYNTRDFGVLPAGYQNGWIRVTSTNGQPITGFVSYAELNAGGVAVVPPQSDAQKAFLFTHIADLVPWYTGLALVNSNATAANVEVFAINPNGTLIGKTAPFVLQPGAKTSKLLSELIPQTQTRSVDGGYVYVNSSAPLFGIELFLSRDTQILSNVPAGRILPGITFVPPAQ